MLLALLLELVAVAAARAQHSTVGRCGHRPLTLPKLLLLVLVGAVVAAGRGQQKRTAMWCRGRGQQQGRGAGQLLGDGGDDSHPL